METSQLICRANQLTGFYMMATSAINELIAHAIFISAERNSRKKLEDFREQRAITIFQNLGIRFEEAWKSTKIGKNMEQNKFALLLTGYCG